MSEPSKPKPGSLKDRIAAFEKKPAAEQAPAAPHPKPKPLGGGWKPKSPEPPSPRKADSGAMSAADAKESISKSGGGLKERMAALQGSGALGGGPTSTAPPLPNQGQPRVWRKVVETYPSKSEEHPHHLEVRKEESEPQPEEEGGEPHEKDPEDDERERRAAIAARMAKLGRGVGMGPPIFAAKPKPKPREEESPQDDVHAGTDETKDTALDSNIDTAHADEKASANPASSSDTSLASPASSKSAQTPMLIPSAPRRAAPPRRAKSKEPPKSKTSTEDAPPLPTSGEATPAQTESHVDEPAQADLVHEGEVPAAVKDETTQTGQVSAIERDHADAHTGAPDTEHESQLTTKPLSSFPIEPHDDDEGIPPMDEPSTHEDDSSTQPQSGDLYEDHPPSSALAQPGQSQHRGIESAEDDEAIGAEKHVEGSIDGEVQRSDETDGELRRGGNESSHVNPAAAVETEDHVSLLPHERSKTQYEQKDADFEHEDPLVAHRTKHAPSPRKGRFTSMDVPIPKREGRSSPPRWTAPPPPRVPPPLARKPSSPEPRVPSVVSHTRKSSKSLSVSSSGNRSDSVPPVAARPSSPPIRSSSPAQRPSSPARPPIPGPLRRPSMNGSRPSTPEPVRSRPTSPLVPTSSSLRKRSVVPPPLKPSRTGSTSSARSSPVPSLKSQSSRPGQPATSPPLRSPSLPPPRKASRDDAVVHLEYQEDLEPWQESTSSTVRREIRRSDSPIQESAPYETSSDSLFHPEFSEEPGDVVLEAEEPEPAVQPYIPNRAPLGTSPRQPPSRQASLRSQIPDPEPDGDGATRQTIAERMAKLGGIKFGMPLPPLRPRQFTQEEQQEVGEDLVEEDQEDTPALGLSEQEEVDPEETEYRKRQEIQAKVAAMGGRGMWGAPVVPPPLAPKPRAASIPKPQFDVTEDQSQDDESDVDPQSEKPDELEEEDRSATEEEAPPPPPPRVSRPVPPPTDKPPPLPPSRGVRPPVPAGLKPKPPTRSLPAKQEPSPQPPPEQPDSSEQTYSEESDAAEDIPPPPPPPPRSTRPSRGPPMAAPPRLEQPKRLETHLNVPSSSVDHQDSETSGWTDEEATHPPPPPPPHHEAQAIPSALPVLDPRQLMTLADKVGRHVAVAAKALQERYKKNIVGDGSSGQFIGIVLSNVPAASAESFGHLVHVQVGPSVQNKMSDIMPGDVIAFYDAKFRGHRGLTAYHVHVGSVNNPTLGIISEAETKKSKIKVFHPASPTPYIELSSYRLEDLKSGTIKVYRVAQRA